MHSLEPIKKKVLIKRSEQNLTFQDNLKINFQQIQNIDFQILSLKLFNELIFGLIHIN
jgi:hypothetical protein